MFQYQNLTLAQVKNLASGLADQLGLRNVIIGLVGPLGAGKTVFAKAFAKTFGIKKTSSPTFVITHQHKIKFRHLYHLDFYRLQNRQQLAPLGLEEVLNGKNIVLIEWVDKFPTIKKRCDILITLKVRPGNKRDVTITNKK